MDLWHLFQPKLSEPAIAMFHNKQVQYVAGIGGNMQLLSICSAKKTPKRPEGNSVVGKSVTFLFVIWPLGQILICITLCYYCVAGSADVLAQGVC